MYIYILIFFIIVILLSYSRTKDNIEDFENCYLNVSKMKKNGNSTFFTNNMIDTYFDRNNALNNLKNVDNRTIQTLKNYQKNVFKSNDEYNRLNNEYITLNNNIEQQFNNIQNELNRKINEANTKKQESTNKFNTIDRNLSGLFNERTVSLNNSITPVVNSAISNNLNEISNNAINNINNTTIFNNRLSSTASNINTWQNIPGMGSPMRIDPETGNVQCLSYDGRNCQWNNNNLSEIRHNEVRPLTCGEDHRRVWGSTGYDTRGHWCNTVNSVIAQNNINQVDWSNCPVGWTNGDREGNICTAPNNYPGPCNRTSYFYGYTPQNKQSWAAGCTARWPFKINQVNSINNLNNTSNIINDGINNKIGLLNPKTVLGQFNTYNNGVYVVAYRLGPNNSRGNMILEGIMTTNINFNWGVGLIFGIRDNNNITNTDMVYLELTGYIKSPINVTNLRLRLTSDDGSRLMFSTNNRISDMRMVIEMWRPQGATSRDSENLVVAPNTYLPFQVQFFEQFGAASLRLEWSINGGAFTVIPRESFYINNEICNFKFNFNYVKEIGVKTRTLIPNVFPFIPVFTRDSNVITTQEGSYQVSIWRAYSYPCFNITTSGYINGGTFGSIFDNNDTTGVDMESYSWTDNNQFGFPYRIVLTLPVLKTYNGVLNMRLVSPWVGCLPRNMTINTLNLSTGLLSNQNWNTPFSNMFQQRTTLNYLQSINLGQVGNAANGPTSHQWNISLTQPFNTIVFEILNGWGSAGRPGSNSVWVTSISFQ